MAFFGLSAQQQPSEIKSILQKLEKSYKIDDSFYDTAYLCLNEQIVKGTPVDKAIWHSCMATFLYNYYDEQRYDILRHTAVVGTKPEDFKVWDLQTLIKEISYHYQKSIEDKELLQKIPIQDMPF